MNKNSFILIFLLFFSSVCVSAELVDKPILTITHCFNLNFTVKQMTGFRTPYYFDACEYTTQWNCKCLNESYTLVMRSNKEDNYKIFQLDINYSIYDLNSYQVPLTVQDWGTWAEANGDANWQSQNLNCKPIEKIVYRDINHTIYTDRTIEVKIPVEVIREVNTSTYIQNITYIENTTRINSLENRTKYIILQNTIIRITLIIIILVFAYFLFKPKNKVS